MGAKNKVCRPKVLGHLLKRNYKGEVEGRKVLVLLLTPKKAVGIPMPRSKLTSSKLLRIISKRRVARQSTVVMSPVTFQEAPNKGGN